MTLHRTFVFCQLRRFIINSSDQKLGSQRDRSRLESRFHAQGRNESLRFLFRAGNATAQARLAAPRTLRELRSRSSAIAEADKVCAQSRKSGIPIPRHAKIKAKTSDTNPAVTVMPLIATDNGSPPSPAAAMIRPTTNKDAAPKARTAAPPNIRNVMIARFVGRFNAISSLVAIAIWRRQSGYLRYSPSTFSTWPIFF